MNITGIESISYAPATKDVMIKHKGKQYARPFAKTVRFNIAQEDLNWKILDDLGFNWSPDDYGYNDDY